MARKKKEPEQQGNEELFVALGLLEKEKGIPVDFMLDKIKKAIATACKNNYGNEEVDVRVDANTGRFDVYLLKTVVEEVEDPNREILYDLAREINPLTLLGEQVGIKLDTKQFHVDILTAGGHKWLNSPFGTGVLYINKETLPKLKSVYHGYLNTKEPPRGGAATGRTRRRPQ